MVIKKCTILSEGVRIMFDEIRESLKVIPFLQLLQIDVLEAEIGKVSLYFENRPDLHQHLGFIHAGALTSLADTACGFAASTVLEEGESIVSVEFKINLIRPAVGERFIATARVLKPGKTIIATEAEITNEKGDLICKMVGTMFRVKPDTYQ